MDQDLRTLLRAWDVDDQYIENFERFKIKKSTLKLLKESTLSKLFPNDEDEGPKLEFEAHLQRYKTESFDVDEFWRNMDTDHSNDTSFERDPNVDGHRTPNETHMSPNRFKSPAPPQEPTSINGAFHRTSATSLSPSASKAVQETLTEESPVQVSEARNAQTEQAALTEGAKGLEALCQKTIMGKMVLAYHNKFAELDAQHRDILADICLCNFLKGDPNRQFSHKDEVKMGQAILDLFPKEIKEQWIGDDNIGREKSAGRGKLCCRWYNMRRKMARVGLIQSSGKTTAHAPPSVSNNSNEVPATPEVERLLVFLENYRTPWNDVLDAWEKTHAARRSYLMIGKVAVKTYMDSFIALKHNDGSALLNLDFNLLYPDAELKMFTEWPVLSAFILSKVSRKGKEEIDDALTSESQKLRVLLSLPRLFPIVTALKKGKDVWRPSRIEAAQGLIQQVKTPGDIKTILEKRQEKYKIFGLTLGPQAIVAVSEDDLILGSYVVINMIIYEVDSPRKALDVVFKAFQALDSPYHTECKREWLFLQLAVYGIETAHDKAALDIKTKLLINEYKNFKGLS